MKVLQKATTIATLALLTAVAGLPLAPWNGSPSPNQGEPSQDAWVPPHRDPFALKKGDSVFWIGESFDETTGIPLSPTDQLIGDVQNDPDVQFPCELSPEHCIDYPLTLLESGPRLRVAVDAPRLSTFGLELYGPDRTFLGSQRHHYSNEMFIEAPKAGEYLVRVVVYEVPPPSVTGVDVLTFRMRALLEDEPKRPVSGAEAMLPNLRATVDMVLLAACDEEEGGLAGARCLRFRTGTENTGTGPLMIRMTPIVESDLLGRPPAYQRILYTDGSFVERPAGTHDPIPHPHHLHFHLDGMLQHELDRVTDEKHGGLEPVGGYLKIGWCSINGRIAGWDDFFQDAVGDNPLIDGQDGNGNCGWEQTDPLSVLSAGWTDLYTRGVTGQQIAFDGLGDGQYVVRSRTDAAGHMVEADEKDNEGYAWIRVTGDEAETLEIGRGHSPWDPHKVVLDPYWL